MANNAMQLQSWIKKYSEQYGVDPELSNAVLMKESSGNPDAVSGTGAKGYMQLFPAAFSDANTGGSIDDPESNVRAGIKYLSMQLKKSGGNVADALGMYNQGATGYLGMKKSGDYAPEVVNYINDPRFSKWVGDQRIVQTANPMKNKIDTNKFTPDQLQRSALKNVHSEAEALAQGANMQPQTQDATDITQKKQTNPLLTTQQQYQNELNQQKLTAAADEANRKKAAFQQMGYMVLGAILGKNAKSVDSGSGLGIPEYRGTGQPLQGYGNKNLANFQISSGGN